MDAWAHAIYKSKDVLLYYIGNLDHQTSSKSPYLRKRGELEKFSRSYDASLWPHSPKVAMQPTISMDNAILDI
jgi:hypothetical protein